MSGSAFGRSRAVMMAVVSFTIDPSSVLWKAPERGRRPTGMLVLLHGYGSNEKELFDQVVPLVPDMVVASVRAPQAEGPGYAWVSLRESLTTVGVEAVFAKAGEAATAVADWLGSVTTDERVGVLGVSQGGVLALHLLRTVPQRIAYVANLSGYILAGSTPGDVVLRKTQPPVFWGRGRLDDLIPTVDIERTSQWLSRHSTLVTATYETGHEVSRDEFNDAALFIRSLSLS